MTRARGAVLSLAVLAAGPCARHVAAHPLQFSYVDLGVGAPGLDVAITVHAFDAAHDLELSSEEGVFAAGFASRHGTRLAALLVSRLVVRADGEDVSLTPIDVSVAPDQRAVVVRLRGPLTGRAGRLQIAGVLFPYDPVHQTFVKIYEAGRLTHQDILTASRASTDYVAGSTQSRSEAFRRFMGSGVEHIVIGPDHVLFLIGLLLMGGGLWQLVRIVTAFTLAHSITLSLAALGLLTPPARVVEPAIALSICWVGIDNLMRQPGTRDRRAWIALGFGLVHGFGFASVLRELGLPPDLLGWSLLAFNVGVEMGQLVIVVVVAGLLAWIARVRPAFGRRVAVAGSVVVIWAGFYWFVERALFG